MLVNRSMPESPVIPVLAYPDMNAAVEWLCAAFGFTVRVRIFDHRVQLNTGEGGAVVVVAGDAASADSVMIRVANVDEHCGRARRHGAKVIGEPTTYPYGERQYSAEDLAGRRWTFSQSMVDVDPRDWGGTLS
ncbi:MAG: VOC family protein [Acidobacteriota bacterium]